MGRLAWSYSRYETWRDCRRRYFYNYFLADGGWRKSASPACRQAYLLKKLSSLPLWTGDIVHKIIEQIVGDLRGQRQPPSLEDAQGRATALLRKGWRESSEGLGANDPAKYLSLAEHYYCAPPTKEECQTFKRRAMRCLKNFYGSVAMRYLRQSQVDYLTSETFLNFAVRRGAGLCQAGLGRATAPNGSGVFVGLENGKAYRRHHPADDDVCSVRR